MSARPSTPLDITHVVLSATFAGVERYVVDVTSALQQRGHALTVIGDPAHFTGRFDETGVTFLPARSVREAAATLVRSRRSIDVVHVHMTAAETAAASVHRLVTAPIVSTRHFAARRGSTAAGRVVAPFIRRQLAAQISISSYVAGAVGEPSTVIPNAVTDRPRSAGSERTILVVQRLDVEKRTQDAIAAFARSGLAEEGWDLLIAGEGNQRAELEALLHDAGVRGVQLLGHRTDVDALRERAAIGLATAPAEPFGLAVAEAMAAGLPVVATSAGGHLETIGRVCPDLLYAPGDIDACAAILRRLAHDATLRRRAGDDARTFAQRSLSMAAHAAEVETVYASVAHPKRRSPDDAPAVLRVHHGGVVRAWRERERRLIDQGCDVHLVSARRWNEGGRDVDLDPHGDTFVVGARTMGRHPYAFVFDPLPIVHEMRRRPLDIIDVHEEPASLAALEMRMLRSVFARDTAMVFYGAQNIDKRYPVPFRWIERGSLRMAAGAYCCNAEAAAIFRRKGLRAPGVVIGLGIDPARFEGPRTDAHSGFRLGYVGRIETRKGVQVLLEAMCGLPHAHLELHGDGPDRAGLESRRDALGLRDAVTFCGFTSEAELPDVYRRFDALAVPSLRTAEWVEQFGRVVVEAMAAGVPVLASDDGALREVVGDAGVLVPPGDVVAWRSAIADVATDAVRRKELAERGRERAATYSWAAIAAQQRSFYASVMR